MKMRSRLASELGALLVVLASSFLGSAFVLLIQQALSKYEIYIPPIAGCKSSVFLACAIGAPAFALLTSAAVVRFQTGTRWSAIGIILGLIASWAAFVGSMFLIDSMGGNWLPIIPALVGMCGFGGYRGSLFISRKIPRADSTSASPQHREM